MSPLAVIVSPTVSFPVASANFIQPPPLNIDNLIGLIVILGVYNFHLFNYNELTSRGCDYPHPPSPMNEAADSDSKLSFSSKLIIFGRKQFCRYTYSMIPLNPRKTMGSSLHIVSHRVISLAHSTGAAVQESLYGMVGGRQSTEWKLGEFINVIPRLSNELPVNSAGG